MRVRRWHAAGQRLAMTLLELLVVVFIIALLMALLLPAVGSVRESGRRVMCANHFRNLSVAVHGYMTTFESFPPASRFRIGGHLSRASPPDPSRHSMITFILPYFEQGAVYGAFDLQFDWNDTKYSQNDKASRQHLGGILICPSAPGERQSKHVSDYNAANRIDPTSAGIGGWIRSGAVRNRTGEPPKAGFGNWHRAWDGVMQRYSVNHSANCRVRCEDRRVVRPKHVIDGMSKTLLLFESAGKPNCYTQGRFDQECTEQGAITRFRWASPTLYMTLNDICGGGKIINCNNNSQPYAFHPGGANFSLADGSVTFLGEDIEADVFVSKFTLAARD